MTDTYMALHAATAATYFEHFKTIANMTIARAKFALGDDESKRFEAEVAKCLNSDGDVASKSERLKRTYEGMAERMKAHVQEEQKVADHLAQQLQALTGVTVGLADAQSIENLSGDAKQKALELALKLATQNARLLELAVGSMEKSTHTIKFAEEDKTMYMKTLQKMAVTLDVFEKSLYAAKDKIEELEKEPAETSKRVAEAVRDMQKLVYKKEDPERPTWSKIQQKPVECLERMAQALKRASDGCKGAAGDAPTCDDCQVHKAKLDDFDKTLVALVTENSKLLDDKKGLLEDRQRDKDDVKRLTEQVAKLRAENGSEKPKKRNK